MALLIIATTAAATTTTTATTTTNHHHNNDNNDDNHNNNNRNRDATDNGTLAPWPDPAQILARFAEALKKSGEFIQGSTAPVWKSAS